MAKTIENIFGKPEMFIQWIMIERVRRWKGNGLCTLYSMGFEQFAA